ncbi:porphobilinogen synthase [Sulfoacidibacillus thermotolerans]|uniref:Delta-aminolevulinic acid dehydratase n=1 Tax=Sulfoacidibacillus thermotolerans TaxID=1765684 RepID=A0A2U3DC40_SULT2|nr:porphobilinogen synthase [Sulfoacidibacillus thermotolerans]PWI58849.1 delta-aminolevulinic acid dehydratase [Sulfoacidibacillus thermotolerans]
MNLQFERHRRLRNHPILREMVRETQVHISDFMYPLFVTHDEGRHPVLSMPGVDHLSLEELKREVETLSELGIPSLMIFGIPAIKDDLSSEAYAEEGIVQQAIRVVKQENPKLLVATDVCLCQYNPAGHCGIVHGDQIVNDESLELLAQTALSHVIAGADLVAPSDMMDGRVAAIRAKLDEAGFVQTPIMAYSVKYASAFYGPFREAAHSAPAFGDRRSYQMDPANLREAIREARSDVAEGADILMVKPALAYMDVIRAVKESFDLPLAAYNVSGEYAMVKAAAMQGWIDERSVVMEMMTGLKRAGAEILISYFAKDVARYLRESGS